MSLFIALHSLHVAQSLGDVLLLLGLPPGHCGLCPCSFRSYSPRYFLYSSSWKFHFINCALSIFQKYIKARCGGTLLSFQLLGGRNRGSGIQRHPQQNSVFNAKAWTKTTKMFMIVWSFLLSRVIFFSLFEAKIHVLAIGYCVCMKSINYLRPQ